MSIIDFDRLAERHNLTKKELFEQISDYAIEDVLKEIDNAGLNPIDKIMIHDKFCGLINGRLFVRYYHTLH